MNEFDELAEQSDLEALKSIVPSWVNERTEPFIPPPDANITPPTWNKIVLEDNQVTSVSAPSSSVSPGTISVVIAKQEGSTFVPVLMTPVNGTLFNTL